MATREERKASRAAHSDPINYTCGECGKVHEFDPDNPYVCPDKVVSKEE